MYSFNQLAWLRFTEKVVVAYIGVVVVESLGSLIGLWFCIKNENLNVICKLCCFISIK